MNKPLPEPIRRKVLLANTLESFILRLLTQTDPRRDPLSGYIFANLSRTADGLAGIQLLALGRHASMISGEGRIPCEAAIKLSWVVFGPGDQLDKFAQLSDAAILAEDKRLRAWAELGMPVGDRSALDGALADLRKRRPAKWKLPDLFQMAAAMKVAPHVKGAYDLAFREASPHTHADFESTMAALVPPSDRDVERALFGATGCSMLLTELCCFILEDESYEVVRPELDGLLPMSVNDAKR